MPSTFAPFVFKNRPSPTKSLERLLNSWLAMGDVNAIDVDDIEEFLNDNSTIIGSHEKDGSKYFIYQQF
jgi:hypothetical protein